MIRFISPQALKRQLSDGCEIALLDTREHGQYGEGHPFYSAHLPYSRLELDAHRLMPNKAVRIVLFGQNNALANLAASRLTSLGYQDVAILEGGVDGWAAAGYALFKGVHVPSKAFGEFVELQYGTPHVSAQQLKTWFDTKQPVVVLDGRPKSEFRKMSIPGAVCCPNAELAYRIHALVADEETPIVVNCAGRTRSIIGAQSLINMGIANPVYALENGTQGWYLNDFQLGHGSAAHYPDVGQRDSAALAARRVAAKALVKKHEVGSVSSSQVGDWLSDKTRTTYLFDVRTPEEFAASVVPGIVHAEGGQLLQGTDLYVGVRNARIVLYDTDGVRAPLVASWLAQLGFETHLLDAGDVSPKGYAGGNERPAVPALEEIAPERLLALVRDGSVRILDLRPSQEYRQAHLADACWSTRSRIANDVGREPGLVVLVDNEPGRAALAAGELAASGAAQVLHARADIEQWEAIGLQVITTPDFPPDEECIDFLFFVHDRHDGNKEAARQYLAWETDLLDQMDEQEKATYRLIN